MDHHGKCEGSSLQPPRNGLTYVDRSLTWLNWLNLVTSLSSNMEGKKCHPNAMFVFLLLNQECLLLLYAANRFLCVFVSFLITFYKAFLSLHYNRQRGREGNTGGCGRCRDIAVSLCSVAFTTYPQIHFFFSFVQIVMHVIIVHSDHGLLALISALCTYKTKIRGRVVLKAECISSVMWIMPNCISRKGNSATCLTHRYIHMGKRPNVFIV